MLPPKYTTILWEMIFFIKSTGHLNRVTSSVLPRVTDNGSQAKNLPTEKYVKSYTKYLLYTTPTEVGDGILYLH